jgi:hypothetical protein
MNGGANFLVNFDCGCVVSEKAILELKPEQCLKCCAKMDYSKLVQLYPESDTLEKYQEQLEAEHSAKKAKKALKKAA